MDPSSWGPGMWSAIHGLPIYGKDVAQIKKFYAGLAVPCSQCQKHLDDFKEENPVGYVQSREGAFLWSLRLHNSVNRKLGKSEFTLSQCWETHCASSPIDRKIGGAHIENTGHVFFNGCIKN